MPGTHYAMGFAVSPPDGQQVLLLEKNRPAFPAGRIEPGEPLRPSAWHGSMHLLAIGANPNTLTKAKAYRFAIKKEVDRYSAIRRRQNALSLAVFYPTCFQALLEAGAMIDRRVVEAIVYVGNWNHYQRRHDPRHRWDMHNIASSIQAMFNHHASACLYREYLDMSDMKIKPAYEILATLYPPAKSIGQPRSWNTAPPWQRHCKFPGDPNRDCCTAR